MNQESDRQTLSLAKDFIAWMVGLVFSSNVACVIKFIPASKSGNVPEYLLPAIIALSVTLIYAVFIFARLVFLSSAIPVHDNKSIISLSYKGMPSLKILLLILVALVFTSFTLVLLWVL